MPSLSWRTWYCQERRLPRIAQACNKCETGVSVSVREVDAKCVLSQSARPTLPELAQRNIGRSDARGETPPSSRLQGRGFSNLLRVELAAHVLAQPLLHITAQHQAKRPP